MKTELLKKLKELKPAENLIDENDEYLSGYKDALKIVKKIVKKLDLHGVNNRRELLIDFLSWYHRPDNCLIDHVYPDLAEQYLKSINSC